MMPRPLYYVVAAILLGMLGSAAYLAFQQHRTSKAIERPAADHAARTLPETSRQADADAALSHRAGRIEEAHAHTDSSTKNYDALRHRLPAVLPALPAVPERPTR